MPGSWRLACFSAGNFSVAPQKCNHFSLSPLLTFLFFPCSSTAHHPHHGKLKARNPSHSALGHMRGFFISVIISKNTLWPWYANRNADTWWKRNRWCCIEVGDDINDLITLLYRSRKPPLGGPLWCVKFSGVLWPCNKIDFVRNGLLKSFYLIGQNGKY